MVREWIKANLALEYVSDGILDDAARLRICERAHAGLIATKAERVIWGAQEECDKLLGKGFWWAEGHEALVQDWQTGDFSTWIDKKIEVKAFGVSFDFVELADLVPAERQAGAMRAISVMSEEDWLSSQDLVRLMYQKHGPGSAAPALLEACRLGQIAGRAMRASGEGRRSQVGKTGEWAAIEWDIPLWFWRNFTDPAKSSRDWHLGKAQGRGIGPSGADFIKLQGVHFHRSGLVNLQLGNNDEPDESPVEARRGRKPEYDWPAATVAIWGQILRGELIPGNQAEIEKAFQLLLAKGDKEPSESTVRPYAKPIWAEFSKA